MTQKHELTAAQTAQGRESSRIIRAANRTAFLWNVCNHLIAFEKDRALAATLREPTNPLNGGGDRTEKDLRGPTLQERVDQLNARDVRTVKGLKLDAQKLSAALINLGADAGTINGLQLKALRYAEKFDILEAEMIDQLWHEWVYHHTRVFIEYGIVGVSKDHPFEFKPISPMEWKLKHPLERDKRAYRWWYCKTPIFAPQVKLVFYMYGMFGYKKVKLSSETKNKWLFP